MFKLRIVVGCTVYDQSVQLFGLLQRHVCMLLTVSANVGLVVSVIIDYAVGLIRCSRLQYLEGLLMG